MPNCEPNFHDNMLPERHSRSEMSEMADGEFHATQIPCNLVVLVVGKGKSVSSSQNLHGEASKGDVVRTSEDTSYYIDIDREGICTPKLDSLENTQTEFDWSQNFEVVGYKNFRLTEVRASEGQWAKV